MAKVPYRDNEFDTEHEATLIVRGKRRSFFKGFVDSEVVEWGASS